MEAKKKSAPAPAPAPAAAGAAPQPANEFFSSVFSASPVANAKDAEQTDPCDIVVCPIQYKEDNPDGSLATRGDWWQGSLDY